MQAKVGKGRQGAGEPEGARGKLGFPRLAKQRFKECNLAFLHISEYQSYIQQFICRLPPGPRQEQESLGHPLPLAHAFMTPVLAHPMLLPFSPL